MSKESAPTDAVQANQRKVAFEEALAKLPASGGERFVTLFTHGSLQVELYAPRDFDPQKPHARDEVYIVAQGHGEYVCEGVRQKFAPGDFLFAAAGESHWFERFSDDFAVWVLFYGPEGGEKQ
ncbi:MAG TPA: cupin domain-containing protein [Blastocatellia bacterium]|nr:cupin domain-containing protein [Blastocatellia bacterium]